MTRDGTTASGSRRLLRSLALVAAGALLAVALGGVALLVDLRFAGGRVVQAAVSRVACVVTRNPAPPSSRDGQDGVGEPTPSCLGGDALAEACRGPLERRLADQGFEPADVVFGPEPTLGSPWDRRRTFGDSFTFRDGAAAVRVDGVVACVVSGSDVTVEFRVSSAPHRNA